AELEMRRAIQQNAFSAEAHYHLGNILRDQGKFPGALQAYQESLRINPDYVYARNALGRTFSLLQQDDRALENFRKAVETDPTNAPAYFNLAIQLEKMQRKQQALESYRKFLELSSEKDHPLEREKAREAIRRLGAQTSQN
ncbi:MAG TPA: tetratricopeptide repeat protein, partial [Acidobacteriota bacterium]|nr:tetratricopeptide repeat protein [Acidobacteriota bacterium]